LIAGNDEKIFVTVTQGRLHAGLVLFGVIWLWR